jgi:hypothetical protein
MPAFVVIEFKAIDNWIAYKRKPWIKWNITDINVFEALDTLFPKSALRLGLTRVWK